MSPYRKSGEAFDPSHHVHIDDKGNADPSDTGVFVRKSAADFFALAKEVAAKNNRIKSILDRIRNPESALDILHKQAIIDNDRRQISEWVKHVKDEEMIQLLETGHVPTSVKIIRRGNEESVIQGVLADKLFTISSRDDGFFGDKPIDRKNSYYLFKILEMSLDLHGNT